MKTHVTIFLLLFIPIILVAQTKIAVAGSGNPFISIMDKTSGKVEWTHPLQDGEECNSVAITPEGAVLYSYSKGAKLINKEHSVIWDFKGGEQSEVQSASLLENGHFLLGICGTPARIVELDAKGNLFHEIIVNLGIENPHSQFRQIRKSKNGNYLLPVLATQKIMEITPAGSIFRIHEISAGAFSVTILDDETLLLPCGDKHYFLYINPETGEEIKRVEDKDLEGTTLLFVAQILYLSNGNLLICNWDGHSRGDTGSVPQLIEITRELEVVWSFSDKENIGKVSAAFYIE